MKSITKIASIVSVTLAIMAHAATARGPGLRKLLRDVRKSTHGRTVAGVSESEKMADELVAKFRAIRIDATCALKEDAERVYYPCYRARLFEELKKSEHDEYGTATLMLGGLDVIELERVASRTERPPVTFDLYRFDLTVRVLQKVADLWGAFDKQPERVKMLKPMAARLLSNAEVYSSNIETRAVQLDRVPASETAPIAELRAKLLRLKGELANRLH